MFPSIQCTTFACSVFLIHVLSILFLQRQGVRRCNFFLPILLLCFFEHLSVLKTCKSFLNNRRVTGFIYHFFSTYLNTLAHTYIERSKTNFFSVFYDTFYWFNIFLFMFFVDTCDSPKFVINN